MFTMNPNKGLADAAREASNASGTDLETEFNRIVGMVKSEPIPDVEIDFEKLYKVKNVAAWNNKATLEEDCMIMCHDNEFALVMFTSPGIHIAMMITGTYRAMLFRLSDLEKTDVNFDDVMKRSDS